MKLKLLFMVLEAYVQKTELLQMGVKIKNVVRLEPVHGVNPPTNVGLIIIDKFGNETPMKFKKVPAYWKGSGYSWKLDINWFKREYNKITPKTICSELRKFL